MRHLAASSLASACFPSIGVKGSLRRAAPALDPERRQINPLGIQKRPSKAAGLKFLGGDTAEQFLRDMVGGTKVRIDDVLVKIGKGRSVAPVREVDALAEGIAHESKVGYMRWSQDIKWQILKDAALVREGTAGISGAHWHFWRSSVTGKIGADPRVLRLLDRKKIPYTIHE